MFSVDHLNNLRLVELEQAMLHLPPGSRILEIGAGTGQQARALQDRGHDVAAIELETSGYAGHRIFPITDYDGRHIPFGDGTFDVVFSSNTLEHVPHLPELHREIHRVLKPGGQCIHILPTHHWRLWTTLAAPFSFVHLAFSGRFTDAAKTAAVILLMLPHGERGNALTELRSFRPDWWVRNFEENGFRVKHDEPVGLFYTGTMLRGPSLGFEKRRALGRRLGSATHLFVLEKQASSNGERE
jgi:SAM-dependent methyltransferase